MKNSEHRASDRTTAMLALAVIAMLLGGSGLTSAFASHYEDLVSTSKRLIGTPYYYVTTDGFENPPDTSIDIKAAHKWDKNSLNEGYYINTDGGNWDFINDYNATIANQDIRDAQQRWPNAVSNRAQDYPNFSYSGTTTNKPSLFGPNCVQGGSATNNGVNEIGFCTLTLSYYAAVEVYPAIETVAGIQEDISEADMIFNIAHTWGALEDGSVKSLPATATHEFGHFYGLGDLYDLYGGSISTCTDTSVPRPVICQSSTSIHEGDKAGLSQIYPKINTVSLSISNVVEGADSAVYTLRHSDGTTNSQYDLMYLFVDYDSAGPTSRIKIKPVWDINSGTGQGTSGPTVTALTLSGRVHDVGATLANIDGQSDSYDMVLTMTREISGTPYVHWITLFDVRKTVSNNGITISSTSPLYFYQNSQGDKGTDVTIFDYDSDGNQDIGIIDSYHNVYTTPWLYFGRIYTNGTVISLTTAGGSGSTVLQFVYTDSDIGFTLMSDTSKRLFSISYADTKWIRQHIVYINGTGAMQFALDEKYAPLHVRGQFAPLGLGQGDAVDFSPDTDNLRDNFNVYYHNSNAYYTIEWDNRVNSHP